MGPRETAPAAWTIGHSSRTSEELLAALQDFGIDMLVDVRRFPGSRRHPQFGAEALASMLDAHGIAYRWIAGLGGRRRVEPGPDHLGWRNASFRSYAAYMETEDFAEGLHELLHLAHAGRACLMCSEVLWWRCHRALVSDVLKLSGIAVWHILKPGSATAHPYTSPAQVCDGRLVYPADPAGCCGP